MTRTRMYIALAVFCLLVTAGCLVSLARKAAQVPEPVPVSTAERDIQKIHESFSQMDESIRQMDRDLAAMDRDLAAMDQTMDRMEAGLDSIIWLLEGHSNSKCLAKAKVCGEP